MTNKVAQQADRYIGRMRELNRELRVLSVFKGQLKDLQKDPHCKQRPDGEWYYRGVRVEVVE